MVTSSLRFLHVARKVEENSCKDTYSVRQFPPNFLGLLEGRTQRRALPFYQNEKMFLFILQAGTYDPRIYSPTVRQCATIVSNWTFAPH